MEPEVRCHYSVRWHAVSPSRAEPRLEHLDLYRSTGFIHLGVLHMLETCRMLRILVVSDSDAVVNAAFIRLLRRSFPQLRVRVGDFAIPYTV